MEGRNAKNYVPPFFFEKAGDKNVKNFAWPRSAKMSSTTGKAYEFDLVILFNALKSTQNLFVLSFLSTITS